MIITDIYRSKLLKYPLTDQEVDLVPQVWEFLKIFKRRFVFIADYRKYLITHISKKYTADKFFQLESILNKMFWNLRWLLFPLWTNQHITHDEYIKFLKSGYEDFENLPYSLLLCNSTKLPSSDKLVLKKLLRSYYLGNTFYRSFVNKVVVVDKQSKTLITKPMEGSSEIFSKNYFNMMSFQILWNKELYTQIMADPFIVRRTALVQEPHFYYQFDYGFPNLNYCRYSIGTNSDKVNRIQKMYYSDSPHNDRFWFKLII